MEELRGLFGGTLHTLEKVMNLRSIKHSLIVSNIANVDTPNYKAFDMLIEENLDMAPKPAKNIVLKRTQPVHFSGRGDGSNEIKFRTETPPEATIRGDGNTVDISKSMGDLAENTLMYNTAAQIISKKFQTLKYVIDDGK